jgi:hypothetical protein
MSHRRQLPTPVKLVGCARNTGDKYRERQVLEVVDYAQRGLLITINRHARIGFIRRRLPAEGTP